MLAKEEIRWAKREFEYDEQKDLKKQKRTKTTKKTTTQPGGGSIIEEATEVVESSTQAHEEDNGQAIPRSKEITPENNPSVRDGTR